MLYDVGLYLEIQCMQYYGSLDMAGFWCIAGTYDNELWESAGSLLYSSPSQSSGSSLSEGRVAAMCTMVPKLASAEGLGLSVPVTH